MSIKTLRKRIALVAVSALGVGLLSVTSANAVYPASIDFKTAAAGDATSGVCSAGAGTSVATARAVQVGGKVVISADSAATEGYYVLSGDATLTAVAGGVVGSTQKTFSAGVTAGLSAVSAGANAISFVVNVTGAGLITVAAYDSTTDTSANDVVYIQGVTTCGSGISVAKSYLQVVDSSSKILKLTQWTAGDPSSNGHFNAPAIMDTSNDEKTTFENADTAYIGMNFNTAYGEALTTSKTVIVSCTNNVTVGGNKGGYYTVADTVGWKQISVAQGTANAPVSTVCTVSVDGTTLGSKSITFLGTLNSIVLSQSSSGNYDSSTSGVLKYYFKDSAGNNLPQAATPILTASTASKITNAITASVTAYGAIATGAQTSYGKVTFNCLDYGDTELSVYYLNDLGAVVTSNVVKAHCGGDFYNFTASLDKASYKTGDIATLTITGKDYANGLVGSDETLGTGLAVAMAGMTAVVAPTTTDVASDLNGTWTYQYQVGVTTGDYTGSVKIVVPSTSSQYNKAVTLQYKITSSEVGVSNAEVLAAIVKLIASINKQIRALQKSLRR